MTVEVRSDPNPFRSAREAVAMAAPGMSPAQRAQAQKELAAMPGQAEIDKTKAEIGREMEAAMRTGTPEEAEAVRQSLQALQQRAGGVVQQTTRVKERWTLIRPSC